MRIYIQAMKRFVLFLPGGRVFRAAARNVSRPPGRKAVLETKVLWRLVGLDTANEHGLLDQRSAFAIGGRVFRAAARNVSRPPGRKAVLETKVLLCLVGLDMPRRTRGYSTDGVLLQSVLSRYEREKRSLYPTSGTINFMVVPVSDVLSTCSAAPIISARSRKPCKP